MEKKKLNVSIAITLFVLLFLVLWSSTALYLSYRKSIQASGEHFSVLSGRAFSVYRSERLAPAEIRGILRPAVMSSAQLQLFYIARENGTVEYLFARDPSLLLSEPAGPALTRNELSIRNEPLTSLVLTERAAGPGGSFEAVGYYSRFDDRNLFSVIQPLFFATLLFTLLFAFMLGAIRDKPSHAAGMLSEKETDETPLPSLNADQDDFYDQLSRMTDDPPKSSAAAFQETALPPEQTEGVSLYSPRSGLCWEDFLLDRLTNELKRSASFEQELTLALVKSGKDLETACYRSLAERFSRVFPMRDMTFEYGANGFAVILPNTSLFTAIEQMREFINDAVVSGKEYGSDMAAGITSRSGRLISGSIIMKEAMTALKRAGDDGESNIIGFRPDPGKFREYLARKNRNSAKG